jgi:hypothetical protein
MVITGECRFGDLESLVGRLNHVCFVIPQARHFMSRLRWLLVRARRGRRIILRPQVLSDLRLWLTFLRVAFEGLSLNLLSFRLPTYVLRSDAAEHGMGGFCAISSRGWRLELPVDCRVGCREGISLNLLEFLGDIVSVWIELLAGRVPPGSCMLAQGDSTSATGWLRKSNFSEHNHPLQLEAARHLATLLLIHGVTLYSQWFAGNKNGLSDVLSRDTHLTNPDLSAMCLLSIPLQVPPNFAIFPVPPVVSSWVPSLLRSQPLIVVSAKAPTRSSVWLGLDGASGSRASASSMTPTSRPSSTELGLASLAPSPPLSEPADFQWGLMTDLLPAQLPVPSIMWRRLLWTPATVGRMGVKRKLNIVDSE